MKCLLLFLESKSRLSNVFTSNGNEFRVGEFITAAEVGVSHQNGESIKANLGFSYQDNESIRT